MTPDSAGAGEVSCSARRRLGIEIRRHRRKRGYSQHQLTVMIGLAARSNVSEYESGRRIPPRDIVLEFERVLQPPPGTLTTLWRKSMAEIADLEARQALGEEP